MNKRSSGFTVIEIIFVTLILVAASVLFFVQKNAIEVSARDEQRKTATNAMYYSLEEVHYKSHKYYPSIINEKVLPSVDPSLFTDPGGNLMGNSSSDYRYEPTECSGGKCKSYTLRASLENEAEYIKQSNRN